MTGSESDAGCRRLDSYPVTPVQQGMLLRTQAEPRGGAYIQQLVCTLPEELDAAALRAAWRGLVERHAVLRTSFHIDLDAPVQSVHCEVPGDLEEHDWRDCGSCDVEARLATHLLDDRRRGFDLDRPPLWRVGLFRLAERDYRLVWTSHHALLDGRSRLLLMRELFARYEAHCSGKSLSLEPPPEYGAYARWRAAQDDERSGPYWREMLRGFNRATALPVRERIEAVPESEPGHDTSRLWLSKELSAALRTRADELGITTNTILQGAWALLLGFRSGSDDVVFGATRACRHSAVDGTASMVGLFINTLPVRVRLDGTAVIADWLRELRAQWIALREHELTSLANVQRFGETAPGQPLFDSIVVFEKFRLEDALRSDGPAWGARSVRLLGTTNYPLVVAGYGGQRMLIELTYDRSRFAEGTIAGMRDHLQSILEGIAEDPHRALREIPILSPHERHGLAVQWNETASPLPNESIPQLFERQAARSPDAVALSCGQCRLTYRELNVRANRLAQQLRKLGVGLETPVALYLERSPELIVGLLGILKAGGAYVPLDVEYPRERIESMLRDTGAPVVLTQTSLADELRSCTGTIVTIDADTIRTADPADEANPACPATSSSLAYIMYTSGSTGTPKGSAIPHEAVIRLVIGADYVRLDPSCVIPQIASVAFDAMTFEVWGALLNGGRIALIPGRLYDLETLSRTLRESGANTLFLTTALFNTVIDEDPGMLSGVRQVLFGGEVASLDHVRQALVRLPGTAITQVYGPTETTTFATFFPIPRELPAECTRIPIGKPIRNTSVHLLDAWGRLVPVGATGEIHIGGPGLARGYWNRPEETARRFVSSPFDADPPARLYRTGDLARRLPDGNIEFLGRLDEQVKIRGFRIEPAEVEVALGRHPQVRQAAVIPRDDRRGTGRTLVAWVGARGKAAPSVEELRSFLEDCLPDYMVPSTFVILDELPLSSNGKVDRRRLPAPEETPRERIASAPRSPVEAVLTGIFAELLHRDDIGIHDDFFELGGHSLLAMQAVSRARKALGVELPLARLFETATVAGLAESVAEFARRGLGEEPLSRVPEPRGDTFPLLSSQISIWDIHQAHAGRIIPNTCRGYRLRGRLDVGALQAALETVVARHEGLRTNFCETKGCPAQIVRPATTLELPLTDLSRVSEGARLAEAQKVFDQEAQHRFDLARDAMFRPRLLRLSAEDHVLLLIFNHIVLDGWSLGLFQRELSALYEAFSTGKKPHLAAPSLQPGDVASWEQRHFRSETGQSHIAYWREHLEGADPQWGLPCAGPHPGDFRSVQETLVVPGAVVDALRESGRREGCTLSMTLFAAFNALLYELTGQEDLLVVTPLAARTRPEIDSVVSCLRKLVILRSDLSGRPSFRELLGRTRETVTGAYAHLDVSQEIVFPERGLDHPLHRMSIPTQFNFMDETERPLALGDLSVSNVDRKEHFHWMSLNLVLVKRERDLALNLKTRAGQYPTGFGREFLETFCDTLKRLAADSEERLNPKGAAMAACT